LCHGDKSGVTFWLFPNGSSPLLSIRSMMAIYWREPQRQPKPTTERGAYTLVVRGPDGRPRYERFDDAQSYLARLTTLHPLSAESVSIEDVLALLDGSVTD
jgi:hypothetical protein